MSNRSPAQIDEVKASSFLIVARGTNGAIGNDRDIPWHHRGDMEHFKLATQGCALIVGRTTFETLPKSMPGREIIVVTSRRLPWGSTAHRASNFEKAIGIALKLDIRAIAFAGGPRIYAEALKLDWLRMAVVTEIGDAPPATAFMPPLGPEWHSQTHQPLASRSGEPTATVGSYMR
jgi:dihydrofolate reductase